MKVFHSGPTQIALDRLGLCQHSFVFILLSIINISCFHNASFANGGMVLQVWGCPGPPTDLGSGPMGAVLQLRDGRVLGESVPALDSCLSSLDSAPSSVCAYCSVRKSHLCCCELSYWLLHIKK